jgi:hypothetical protein
MTRDIAVEDVQRSFRMEYRVGFDVRLQRVSIHLRCSYRH